MLRRLFSATTKQLRKPPGNPALNLREINKILQTPQHSITYKSPIHRIDTSQCASNCPIEDEYFTSILEDGSIVCGVVDGHWSNDCAKTIRTALPSFINKYCDLSTANQLVKAFQELDKQLLDLPWKYLKGLDGSWDQITQIPLELRIETLRNSMPAFSGACAVAAHITPSFIHIAHAGDCRAILGKRVENGWKSFSLTADHQPSNLDEFSRLNSEHPNEESTVAFNAGDGPLRVLGGMMPSRSFGDARYKYSLEKQSQIDALLYKVPIESYAWLCPPHLYTPPYLTATPDIMTVELSDSHGFLVLASDGIFDVFNNKEVVDIVGEFLDNGPSLGDNAATYLIRKTVEEGRGIEYLSRMLTLDPTSARRWRDDMTVQVVLFDSVKALSYNSQYNMRPITKVE